MHTSILFILTAANPGHTSQLWAICGWAQGVGVLCLEQVKMLAQTGTTGAELIATHQSQIASETQTTRASSAQEHKARQKMDFCKAFYGDLQTWSVTLNI